MILFDFINFNLILLIFKFLKWFYTLLSIY
jgi:hypothetical protein